jgi:anti-sigma factor RsiW
MSEVLMSCTPYVWKVGPYVDGELPAAERDEVGRHLESCADCRELAAAFRDFDRIADGVDAPSVSAREWAAVLERVTREERIVEVVHSRRRWEWLLPAEALAALLLIGIFLGQPFFTSGSSPSGGFGPAESPDARLKGEESSVPIETPPDSRGHDEDGRLRPDTEPKADTDGGF